LIPELARGGCQVAEATQAKIDETIRQVIMGNFDRAYRILELNKVILDQCAKDLLIRETLGEVDIRKLTARLAVEAMNKQ
jgi:cell division protease FtsH